MIFSFKPNNILLFLFSCITFHFFQAINIFLMFLVCFYVFITNIVSQTSPNCLNYYTTHLNSSSVPSIQSFGRYLFCSLLSCSNLHWLLSKSVTQLSLLHYLPRVFRHDSLELDVLFLEYHFSFSWPHIREMHYLW